MLFTAATNKLELHQIDLASFWCESGFDRAAAIDTPNTRAIRITRHLEWLIDIRLHFQLREAFKRGAVGRC